MVENNGQGRGVGGGSHLLRWGRRRGAPFCCMDLKPVTSLILLPWANTIFLNNRLTVDRTVAPVPF